MARCQYCGRSLGWFQQSHPECEAVYNRAWYDLIRTATDAVLAGQGWETLSDRLALIADEGYCTDAEIAEALALSWLSGVDVALDDDVLTMEEVDRLGNFYQHFDLLGSIQGGQLQVETALRIGPAHKRMQHALALQILLEGYVPPSDSAFPIPLNLTRTEMLVWGFDNCTYYEDAVSRSYVGGSAGVSVRVARGVYFRSSNFKGYPVETAYLKHVDSGIVVLTTEHIYFAGPRKTLRVPYSKVVGYRPYSDGIGIWRDTASARQQVFATGDGWFTYNLVSNLAKGVPLKQLPTT